MSLKEGHLLFFPDFIFTNGNKSDGGKYFLVLKSGVEDLLLVSLPSSQSHIPRDLFDHTGCYYDAPSVLSFYAIKKMEVIATSGFSFPKDTWLYGQLLQTYNKADMQQEYPQEGIDYEIKGALKAEILKDIHDCFKNSEDVVKKRFREMI